MSDVTINIKRGPYRKDYFPYSGDTFTDGFYLTSAGVAIDLTGSTFKMRIVKVLDGTVPHTLTIGSGIVVVSNLVTFVLSAAQMESLAVTKYKYDLRWTRADTTVKTLIAGFIYPNDDVTPP